MSPGTYLESGFRRFATFEVNLSTHELRKNGSRVRLQEQPFLILAMLLEKPGELVTYDQLKQKLWPADTFVDFDQGVKEAVYKLRQTLGDSATTPRFIETLPKLGYRFIYPIDRPKEMRPARPKAVPRLLFLLIQATFLAIYVSALARLGRVEQILSSWFTRAGNELAILMLVTAVLGIALRLFLLNAVAFDHPGSGHLFRRVFWPIFLLDGLWSLSPFLLAHKIGIGLAFAAFATLIWLPFAQRTLIRMAYPIEQIAAVLTG